MKEFIVGKLTDLPEIAASLLPFLEERKVWRFDGEMGAGKTTLIQAICLQMGVQHTVQSPTFAIVNEYEDATGNLIYHFDCYRLKSVEEALNIGVEEYLYSGNYCFIEWASRIESILPDDTGVIEIQEINNEKRKITVYLP